MKTTTAKLFVQLLEHIVNETSTTIATLQGVPGAAEMITALHQKRIIGHDIEYTPIKKIPWSDVKAGNTVILVAGPDSAGLLYFEDYDYKLYAYNQAAKTVDSTTEDSGKASIDWLQIRTGKINRIWVGDRDTGKIQNTKRLRKERQSNPATTYYNSELFANIILKRFKPLWLRSLIGAQNDVKGWVNTQIKNHAFEKAKSKLAHLQKLEDAVEAVERGADFDTGGLVRTAIQNAVMQTTHMYYPEATGGLERGYGTNMRPERYESIKLLFDDITAGDTNKLGTLLAFFRRNLVTGK